MVKKEAVQGKGLIRGCVWVTRNRLCTGLSTGDGDTNKSSASECLIVALDSDSRTGALAAQAIGNIGGPGVAAVPALVKLLSSEDEGLRNTACIALGGIGPSARSALPQLERALTDPSNNVRGFARLAMAKINGSVLP